MENIPYCYHCSKPKTKETKMYMNREYTDFDLKVNLCETCVDPFEDILINKIFERITKETSK